VQRHLWRGGFPCPRPLTEPQSLGRYAAHAETLVAGGDLLPPADGAAGEYADLLAELLRRTPPVDTMGSLDPAPPWVNWNHDIGGVWPPADDRDDDLNAHAGSGWLDDIGRRVRARLERFSGDVGGPRVPTIVGHGDWEAQNLRWRGRRAWVVHDWDSLFSGPEVVIVGLAAAVWPAGTGANSASFDQTGDFLAAYQRGSARPWTRNDVEAAWAAGLWVRTFNAKKAAVGGDFDALDRDTVEPLLRQAGL
jgi:Ser/Thr protein kinase RdoA (MazF antagonist)